MRDDDERVATVLTRASRLSDDLRETVAELVELLIRHTEPEADDGD